jgi:hypothetical protein
VRRLLAAAGAFAVCLSALHAAAQQPKGGWQIETAPGKAAPQPPPARAAPPPTLPTLDLLPNLTIVPRAPAPRAGVPELGPGQVALAAVLTDDGQDIEQGLVWRVFRDRLGPDGRPRIVATHREPAPTIRLEPGGYVVNVAMGRAHLTRKIAVSGERGNHERFVLNAGGLRLTPAVPAEIASERSVFYDIYSDERDQYGQRTKVLGGARPGIVIRLNAGIYNVVGTFGDANAISRADITVEAGKLTEATLSHAAAKVTFKLVTRAGGDAIPDTQWSIANAQGEVVKESVGALPSHILAPGTYTASATHAGRVFQRAFAIQAGQAVQVEVVMR